MAAETILVADDDRAFVQFVSSSLKARGFNVVHAFDSIQAMMAIRRSHPAAMVLDILMPGGTGVEVLKRLRTFSGMAPMRVIAVSASTDPELPQRVKELGADEFLLKPLDLDELHRVLCRLLGRPVEQPPPVG
jgi:DNA-binding response OmpR family regulator